jgi:xanthine dehydrogenase iron-sulfur cluster and FAD-binding subunit A
MGTIGRNISNASLAGYMIPSLYALDAEITLSGLKSE